MKPDDKFNRSKPVHVDSFRKVKFLVNFFRPSQLSVELKAGQFKGQNRWQSREPELQEEADRKSHVGKRSLLNKINSDEIKSVLSTIPDKW